MTFPTDFPEIRGHMQHLVTLLEEITYLSENVGGGGIHPVAEPGQAIDFSNYAAPAVVINCSGSNLGSSGTQMQGGVLFEEFFQFDITTINANFDVQGSGQLNGQVTGDPGAAVLITDIRKALYGKRYMTESVWADGGLKQSVIYPANPPFKLWFHGMDPNKVFHNVKVQCSWAILA